MRYKDENKKMAIFNSALELITKNGFADTSISKIAKTAKISSSTIYVYFENKEDMLNKLYLWIKEESGNFILKDIDEKIPIKDGIKLLWNNVYNYIISEPVKFSFSEQFANSPIINKINKKGRNKHYQSLFNLLERGIAEKIIKKVPTELLVAHILAPITYLVKQQLGGKIVINDEMINISFELTWSSIKK